MARAVYAIPRLPNRENGANELKFLSQHNGKSTKDVTPSKDCVLVEAIPAVAKSDVDVSAKIMLYANTAAVVLKVQLTAGIQLVLEPTDSLQASRYDVAPV